MFSAQMVGGAWFEEAPTVAAMAERIIAYYKERTVNAPMVDELYHAYGEPTERICDNEWKELNKMIVDGW